MDYRNTTLIGIATIILITCTIYASLLQQKQEGFSTCTLANGWYPYTGTSRSGGYVLIENGTYKYYYGLPSGVPKPTTSGLDNAALAGCEYKGDFAAVSSVSNVTITSYDGPESVNTVPAKTVMFQKTNGFFVKNAATNDYKFGIGKYGFDDSKSVLYDSTYRYTNKVYLGPLTSITVTDTYNKVYTYDNISNTATVVKNLETDGGLKKDWIQSLVVEEYIYEEPERECTLTEESTFSCMDADYPGNGIYTIKNKRAAWTHGESKTKQLCADVLYNCPPLFEKGTVTVMYNPANTNTTNSPTTVLQQLATYFGNSSNLTIATHPDYEELSANPKHTFMDMKQYFTYDASKTSIQPYKGSDMLTYSVFHLPQGDMHFYNMSIPEHMHMLRHHLNPAHPIVYIWDTPKDASKGPQWWSIYTKDGTVSKYFVEQFQHLGAGNGTVNPVTGVRASVWNEIIGQDQMGIHSKDNTRARLLFYRFYPVRNETVAVRRMKRIGIPDNVVNGVTNGANGDTYTGIMLIPTKISGKPPQFNVTYRAVRLTFNSAQLPVNPAASSADRAARFKPIFAGIANTNKITKPAWPSTATCPANAGVYEVKSSDAKVDYYDIRNGNAFKLSPLAYDLFKQDKGNTLGSISSADVDACSSGRAAFSPVPGRVECNDRNSAYHRMITVSNGTTKSYLIPKTNQTVTKGNCSEVDTRFNTQKTPVK